MNLTAASAAILALGLAGVSAAQPKTEPPAPTPPAQTVTPTPEPKRAKDVLEIMREQAAAARPLVKTDAARAFLDSTARLPMPEPQVRVVWRDRVRGVAYSQREYDALPPVERTGLAERKCEPTFYYFTGYGTPLVYARPLDLFAEKAGIKTWAGLKVCDFGYGSVGHLRLLAQCGAETTGIEVEPLLRALYSEPNDTGVVLGMPSADGSRQDGRITLLHGRWPAEEGVKKAVADASGADGYDVFISKNTLKRGYIHPARQVDERFLVKLGVSDEEFVKAVRGVLKPGGWFLIYNLSPRQAPDDKPYLPHADGECPFPRALLEAAGFEVLEFDREDREAAVDWWLALGIAEGTREAVREDLFAWWTLARKK